MLDREILNRIEQRIKLLREVKEEKEFTQTEWDREYLYRAVLDLVMESVKESIPPPEMPDLTNISRM